MDEKVVLLGPLDRVIFLKTLPALQGLSPSHLAAIAQHTQERFFPRGSMLLDPSQTAQGSYLVVEGDVEVHRTNRPSQRIGPGEAVGFLHLLAKDRTGLSARARADSLTLELDGELQLDLCEEHFPILRQYLRYLCTELISQQIRPADLSGSELSGYGSGGALDLVERLLILRQLKVLSGTDLDGLYELARQATELTSLDGTVWRPGEVADHFLLLVSGSLACHDDEKGTPRQVLPGQTAGLSEALAELPRQYWARTDQELVALRIDIEAFLDLLEDHFEMAMDFVSALSLQLIELLEKRSKDTVP